MAVNQAADGEALAIRRHGDVDRIGQADQIDHIMRRHHRRRARLRRQRVVEGLRARLAAMAAQRYKTLPGLEPMTPKYKKKAGGAPPSEDDAGTGLGEAERYLRLGNMMLLRNRLRPASVDYEKGHRLAAARTGSSP